MSKVCGPKLFISLFLLIGLPMASLSNEPDSKCNGMTESPRFKEMIKKLQQQVPIEMSAYQEFKFWNEHGVVNYYELLLAMKSLMEPVENKNKEIKNKNIAKILRKKCVTMGCIGIFGSNVTEVLNEALECAIEIHNFIKQQNETGEKFWTNLDREFEKALQTIWVLNEPDAECHNLANSDKFTQMIKILQNKIPIMKGEKNDIEAKDKMEFSKVLFAINRIISELIYGQFDSTIWALENGYVPMTDKYSKIVQPLKDLLIKKYGIYEPAGRSNYAVVVSVLEEALKCATTFGWHFSDINTSIRTF